MIFWKVKSRTEWFDEDVLVNVRIRFRNPGISYNARVLIMKEKKGKDQKKKGVYIFKMLFSFSGI